MLNQTAIMTRVIFLYRLKRVCFSPVTRLSVFLVLTTGTLFLISLPHVVINLWQTNGFNGRFVYLFQALLHTDFLVQLSCAGLLLFGLLLARDLLKYQPFFSWHRV